MIFHRIPHGENLRSGTGRRPFLATIQYSNATAGSMKEEIREVFGRPKAITVFSRAFHRVCQKLIGDYDSL
jgi:hypothetical protein